MPDLPKVSDLPGMPEHKMPVQFLPDLSEHQPVQLEKLHLPDERAM